MPSYRHTRDIRQEDLQPETGAQRTRGQRFGNWWHYHWKWLLLFGALLSLLAFLLFETLGQRKPDLVVGVLSATPLSAETTEALAAALAAQLPEGALVEVQVYEFVLEEDAGANPYNQAAAAAQFTSALSSAEIMLFLTQEGDTAAYQASFQLYALPDGSLPASPEDVDAYSTRLESLPGLAGAGLPGFRAGVKCLEGTRLAESAAAGQNQAEAFALLASLGA